MKKTINLFFIIILSNSPCFLWSQEINSVVLKKLNQLENYADSCSNTGDIESALSAYTEIVEIRKKTQGIDHPDYATSLGYLALLNGYLGNYEEAIKLGTDAKEIGKKILGVDHPDYATNLSNLAGYNSDFGNYAEAIKLGSEAIEIRKRILGVDHPDYAASLNNLAHYYSSVGNYAEAISLVTEALEIRKRILGVDHPDYAASLNNLAHYYSSVGNYAEAISLVTEALEIQKRILGVDHPDYATSLSNLAGYNYDFGNYVEAIRLETEAIKIRKKVLGIDHPDYVRSLNNLASFNFKIGNYSETLRLGTEVNELFKKALGINHPDYVISLINLIAYNSRFGNYAEAVRLGTEAVEIAKKQFGLNHPSYATLLNNLADLNSNIGNYAEAVKLETESIEIFKETLGTEHPDFATCLSNLANYNSYLGKYGEAISWGTEALEIRKRILGVDHPDYAASLNNLSFYNFKLGNYEEALRLVTESSEKRKRILGVDHPLYATSLGNLASCNAGLGNYVEAIKLGTEAMELLKNKLGVDHPDYVQSLSNLVYYNTDFGNYSGALKYVIPFIEGKAKNIIRNFSNLSSQRRQRYWNSEKYFVDKLNELCFRMNTPTLISLAYDKSALLSKGILLNTEIEIKKLIEESGDAALVDAYQQILTNYEIYNKQSSMPIAERRINTDSLNNVIQRQEDNLVRKAKAYGDYTQNLKYTWNDVRKSLSKGDIAIEFLDFPVGRDSVMYVALTLKKGYDNPRMIPLFETKQLKRIHSSTYYRLPRLAKLVWGPLEEELTDVKIIYFSPSGELHKIGIEYLPLDGDTFIIDKYQMHRLSSTRQIITKNKHLVSKQAVLYGGIDYDAPMETSFSSNLIPSSCIQIPSDFKILIDSLPVRGTWGYLEGTKKEADDIAVNLKQETWTYDYYTGKDGTEESFKGMSGKSPSLLHVATHGFYMTEDDAIREQENERRHQTAFMTETGNPVRENYAVREDKPMTRSGLLLSGCNHSINHDSIPEGREDGILTAQEIAYIDLRGLDLVVLSACETGLGDIVSGEGVFGLQRGFKKAGANTIIMSLWKVPDEATATLMTNFYRNYLGGMSKAAAFSKAREVVRSTCSPRQTRPDWAAFIMLDGIN